MKMLKHQEIPPGDWWDVWYLNGERASGKTTAAVNFVISEVNQGKRILWVAVNNKMEDFVAGTLLESDSTFKYNRSTRTLTHPNGGVIQFHSLSAKPESLRGSVFSAVIWEDVEYVSDIHAQELYSFIRFSLRLGSRPRLMFTGSSAPPNWLRRELTDRNLAYTIGSVSENIPNLSPHFVATFIK